MTKEELGEELCNHCSFTEYGIISKIMAGFLARSRIKRLLYYDWVISATKNEFDEISSLWELRFAHLGISNIVIFIDKSVD